MKAALLNPPLYYKTVQRLGPITENLFYNSPPLGLCYLASVLEEAHHEVNIIDAAVEDLSVDRVLERMDSFAPDAVGITTFTVSVYSVYAIAEKIKARFPGIKIIAGGPHITSNPYDILQHPEIDAAVIGEGEITFKELIGALERKEDISKIKGLAYSVNGKMFFTSQREFISELDILPFPARHLVPIRLYRPQPNDQKRLPKLSMISSRGCPYPCIFCDKNVFRNAYRSFSPKYIAREMLHLTRDYRAKDIAFVDSTFSPNKKRVYDIIKEIKNSNLDVAWTCSIRADVVDRELLKEMKDAGCWRVRLGIESGDDEVLKFIKKGTTKCQVRKVADWAYELDLEPKGFFMVGHLVDTKKTIEETISFACELPLKDITVQMNTPLKNTQQYQLIEKYGSLMTEDFSDYSFWHPVFISKELNEAELRHYYRKFYLRFYLRPAIWYRHIVKIRSFSDIIKYLRGIKVIFFFLISWLKERS